MFGSRAMTRLRAGHWHKDKLQTLSGICQSDRHPNNKIPTRVAHRAQLKLAAINAALAARLFNADFNDANLGATKICFHLTAN